jgi:hypothetical protein
MPSAVANTSRASPRCRTCNLHIKHHPKPTCSERKRWESFGLIARPVPSLPDPNSISSAPKEETIPLSLPSLSTQRKRFARNSFSAKPKSVRFSWYKPSSMHAPVPITPEVLASGPPSIEELTAFLLGIDRPVDPATARFALSLLDESADSPSVEDVPSDADLDPEETRVATLRRQRQRAHRAPSRRSRNAGVSWIIPICTHLFVALMASAFTALLLGSTSGCVPFLHCSLCY